MFCFSFASLYECESERIGSSSVEDVGVDFFFFSYGSRRIRRQPRPRRGAGRERSGGPWQKTKKNAEVTFWTRRVVPGSRQAPTDQFKLTASVLLSSSPPGRQRCHCSYPELFRGLPNPRRALSFYLSLCAISLTILTNRLFVRSCFSTRVPISFRQTFLSLSVWLFLSSGFRIVFPWGSCIVFFFFLSRVFIIMHYADSMLGKIIYVLKCKYDLLFFFFFK